MRLPPLLNPYGELFSLLRFPEDSRLRKKLIWAYSWAVPSSEAIAELASHGPLIEIGAGTGYWACLLTQAGVDIVAYDRNTSAPPHWFEVHEGGPEKLHEHSTRTLFLCWPSLDEGLATECLGLYRGDSLLYIGENGPEARTGEADFRNRLETDFRLVSETELPKWPGFNDSLRVYVRKI